MRQLGLDIFRSIAIFLVFIAHLETLFLHHPQKEAALPPLGQWGVDFFFVLSGFLIGRILIRSLVKHKDYQWIPHFIYRRWLKTLPLYYLVLFFYAYLYGFPQDFLLYVFHIKGLVSWTDPIFFGASWSLFVEEFFYIACALCAFSFYFIKKESLPITLLKFCFLIILTAVFYRILFVLFYTQKNNLMNITIARLDAPIFGFILAIIKEYYPTIFYQMEKNRYVILVIGFLVILSTLINTNHAVTPIIPYAFLFIGTAALSACMLYILIKKMGLIGKNPFFNSTYKKALFYLISLLITIFLFKSLLHTYLIYFSTTWSFTIIGFSSAMVLLYFATLPELNLGDKTRSMILFFSESSYAVYLTHELVIKFCFSFIKDTPKALEFKYGALTAVLSIMLTYFLCYFLVKFIEKPILAWRDRRFFL
jgi:peptidoglycan/LPS O-acetylase OafA/YrhL